MGTLKKAIRPYLPDSLVHSSFRALNATKYQFNKYRNIGKWYGDDSVTNYQDRIKSFKGRYANKRCFIMGNGPSLNETPLDLLSDDYVWGLNRCHLLFDRIDWRPSFYTAVDTRVVPDNAEEIDELRGTLTDTQFFFPLEYRYQGILHSGPNVHWFRQKQLDANDMPGGYYSVDSADHVRSVRTVTITAIQLAAYFGFNPIYLIGCDTNYTVPKTSEYEDDRQSQIVGTRDDDMSHFDPSYFGTGKKYHQPHPDLMISSYQQVAVIADSIGLEIYNATIGGMLEVFPRVEFQTLF